MKLYSGFVLPPKNRLNKKKDFQKVFQQGKGIKENLLVFKWVSNNLRVSRFGFVISQKVSKKAVARNKLRRRLKEKFKKELPRLKTGVDGVIIVGPGAAKEDNHKINLSLAKIFSRAKIIKKNERNNL